VRAGGSRRERAACGKLLAVGLRMREGPSGNRHGRESASGMRPSWEKDARAAAGLRPRAWAERGTSGVGLWSGPKGKGEREKCWACLVLDLGRVSSWVGLLWDGFQGWGFAYLFSISHFNLTQTKQSIRIQT